MKTLLALLLLIPSLSWGSEEKARKLYVQSEIEFKKKGCSINEFKSHIGKVSTFVFQVNLMTETNYTKNEVIDLITDIGDTVLFFERCAQPFLDEVVTRYEKIVIDYPSTEVAYKIIERGDYISSEEAKQITDVVSSISKNYKNIKIKYGIKDKMEKKDELIDFKAKDVEQDIQEIITEEEKIPMTVSDVYELQNQIYGCLNISGFKAEKFKSIKPIIIIEVNRNRTIESAKLYNKEKLSDPDFRVAAEAALRAVNNPDCSPLKLPKDKYNTWKEIKFIFDFSWFS